jgi:hypothetical protein
MTFRPARPMLLTIGTLAILAAPAWAQSMDPNAFPPPPPVPPFVPPPERGVVAASDPSPSPLVIPPNLPSDPPPIVAPPISPPPIVAAPIAPPPLPPPPDLPLSDYPFTTQRIPGSIQSRPRYGFPVDPGELKPANPGYMPSDSMPFWMAQDGFSGSGLHDPNIQRSLLNDFELLPFGLAVQAPSFIDQAAPIDVFRVRADAFYNMLRPDRAEYFWQKQSYLNDATGSTDAHGPPVRDWKVNAQILSFYVEARISPEVSIFTNIPVRFTDPEFNLDHSGLGDVSAGIKWAFVLDSFRAITAQVTGTFPTGQPDRGTGSGEYLVEPALLWQEVLTDRLVVYAQVKDSIPIGQQTDFAGNILTYGLGGSFVVAELGHVKVIPTVEGVGWTILSGKETPEYQAVNEPLVQESHGKTIVNVYGGIRFTLGDSYADHPFLAMSDLYVGYGHAVTGTRWYRDIYRIEYRLRF